MYSYINISLAINFTKLCVSLWSEMTSPKVKCPILCRNMPNTTAPFSVYERWSNLAGQRMIHWPKPFKRYSWKSTPQNENPWRSWSEAMRYADAFRFQTSKIGRLGRWCSFGWLVNDKLDHIPWQSGILAPTSASKPWVGGYRSLSKGNIQTDVPSNSSCWMLVSHRSIPTWVWLTPSPLG